MKLFGESSPENREFKQWVEMAENDPELFEKLRQDAINKVIDNAPKGHRQRLRRLQWRIDQERRQSKSPLSACMWLSRMMWESIAGRGGLLENLSQIKESPFSQSASLAPATKAEVLPFRAPGSQ